jgi:acetoin utilization protein AcuC
MSHTPATAFVYSDRYAAFNYGPGHPFRNERLALTAGLCRAYGLLSLPSTCLVQPREAAEDEVTAFHRPEYLAALRTAEENLGMPGLRQYGLGTEDNPVFPGMVAWSLLSTGGSLVAMELVENGEVRCAFNIAGGLHHAAPARAAGFCYLNDAAVVIELLRRRGRRVAYVDIDAHHGDGVQFGFYDTDAVLTISLHETGRTLFPGTGEVTEIGRGRGQGFAVNAPLLPGSDDEIFLWVFERVVPPLLAAFRPDVVVTQLGADTHRTDPLAHLALTTQGFGEAVRRLEPHAGRWIALGGGGYSLDAVPRAWTLAWAIMNGVEIADELPDAFRTAFHQGGHPSSRIRDHDVGAETPDREQAWRFAREQVRSVQSVVFPYHGL